MKYILKSLLCLFYVLTKINWRRFYLLYNSKATNVVVLSFINGRFGNELLFWDFGYINALISGGEEFRVAISFKGITNKVIYWSPSKYYSKNIDYSKELISLAIQAESCGNKVVPSSYELLFLENKTFMYKKFKEKGIPHPETFFFNNPNEILNSNLKYPLLLKGEHSSGSQDIFKFNEEKELLFFLQNSDFCSRFNTLIVQELLNIRKDLRVTYVGDKVVLSYWRMNMSEEWKPTASSFGGLISFDNFPSSWESVMLNHFRTLELPMGAFDVAWNNDDLTTQPYFLEVSSRFSPNPPYPIDCNLSYKLWKKKLFGRHVFYKSQCDLIFEISKEYLLCVKI